MALLELIALIGLRFFFGVLNLMPMNWRVGFLTGLSQLFFLLVPKYKRFALRNLQLAFPQLLEHERGEIYQESIVSLARVLVDFARLPQLDRDWMKSHVQCDFLQRFFELKKNSKTGVLLVTGHLSSFELLAHFIAAHGNPIHMVVRSFKTPRINAWWKSKREAFGNQVIDREGAFKEIGSQLQAGKDVAILFDQNVRDKHAVFVPWFGLLAATTRAPALVALKTECPVVVAGIRRDFSGLDRYIVMAEEVDLQKFYRDGEMDRDEKVRQITAIFSAHYESMIQQSRSEWFWVHRRWKTRPKDSPQAVY